MTEISPVCSELESGVAGLSCHGQAKRGEPPQNSSAGHFHQRIRFNQLGGYRRIQFKHVA
jgi:hypothetical protein